MIQKSRSHHIQRDSFPFSRRVCFGKAQPPFPPQMLEWGVKTPGGRALHSVHWSWQGLVRRGGGGDIYYYKLLKQSRDTLEMSLWSRLVSGNVEFSCLHEIRNEHRRVILYGLMIFAVHKRWNETCWGRLSVVSLSVLIKQNQAEIESKTRSEDVRQEPGGECLWYATHDDPSEDPQDVCGWG